jgi:nudix-type nucleoside diphosphatase (YffH/AdpP family)
VHRSFAVAPGEFIHRSKRKETGFAVRAPRKIFEAYMSPGAVTERLHFYVDEYEAADRLGKKGENSNEGEDVQVLEVALAQAMEMISTGEIQDGKIIILLQHAALVGLHRL